MYISSRTIRAWGLGVGLLLIGLICGRPGALAAAPARAHLTPEALASVDRAARELPRLHSLLIERRGELLFEEYYNGARPDRPGNIKSVSKSIISALVGVAIETGAIPGVRAPIGDYFTDVLAGEENARKRAITIEDLLTMQSGLQSTSNQNYGAWVLSADWVRHALTRPLQRAPGTGMDYSTGNTHLLSAILTRVTGMDTWRFAQEHLAAPLGFSLPRWIRDPQGVYFGGNDMLLTPRQLLTFGRMYLDHGRIGDVQVIPESWVRTSWVARTPSPREWGRFYGYGWWIRQLAGHATYYAWGYGGQFVFVVPNLDLVVVATSDSNPGDSRRGHNNRIYQIVEHLIVAPIAAAPAPPAAR